MRPRELPYEFASAQAVPGIWWHVEEWEPHATRAAIPPSRWDERALNHIEEHLASELSAGTAYDAFAEHGDPSIRYLAGLIASDERRHHRILLNLADALRTGIAGEVGDADQLESVPLTSTQRAELLADTQRLLEIESRDAAALKELQADLSPAAETLWPLLAEYMALDTDKHIRVLKAIEARLKH